MIVSAIVAVSENGVIGLRGDLPWRLPADLRDFKKKTMGKTLILGRKTYQSLKGPLPGRKLVVVTRGKEISSEGVRSARSLPESLEMCAGEKEVMIAGGEEIYRQALPFVERIYLTMIHARFEGDAYFPLEALADFRLVSDDRHAANGENRYDYSFRIYERERKANVFERSAQHHS
jgi:dihydrofolate reductase